MAHGDSTNGNVKRSTSRTRLVSWSNGDSPTSTHVYNTFVGAMSGMPEIAEEVSEFEGL